MYKSLLDEDVDNVFILFVQDRTMSAIGSR